MLKISSLWGSANRNHNEIPLYTNQVGSSQKDALKHIFMRMWGNWDSHTLLIEIYIVTDALENSLSFLQNVKYETYDSASLLLDIYPRE